MRHWIGMCLLGVAGIAATLLQAWQSLPAWGIALTILLTAGGVTLTWPVRREQDAPRVSSPPPAADTAFIRGDASGSTMVDVSSDAQVFIEGDARETFLSRIIHRRQG